MSTKIGIKERVNKFVEDFHNHVLLKHSGPSYTLNYSDFILFIDRRPKSELKDILSSTYFNKPELGYWKEKKSKIEVSKLTEKYKTKELSFSDGWFLDIEDKYLYKSYLVSSFRHYTSQLAGVIPSFRNFVLSHGSDYIKMSCIKECQNKSAISKRRWNIMFDSATTLKFKIYCMQYISKKKSASYLKERYKTKSQVPWAVLHELTNKNIFSENELSCLFANDDSPNKNSEFMSLIDKKMSTLNDKNAKETLNWIFKSIDNAKSNNPRVNTSSGNLHYLIGRSIRRCICLMKKEDLLFFIGNEDVSDYEQIISLKLSCKNWS